MKRRTTVSRATGLCLATAGFGIANAAIVISNHPGNDATQSAGLNTLRMKGMAFTTDAQAWVLDSAVLRLNANAGAAPIFTLNADGGTAPGVALFTFTNPGSFGTGIQDYTFTGGFALNPNTKYWLVLGQTGSSSPFDWKASSPAQTPTGTWTHTGSVFTSNGGSTWSTSSILTTYFINATVVPEPVTLVALGVGLAAIARRRRS